jgi:hypothetical protein
MRLSLSSLSRSAELSPLSPPSPGLVPCVQLFGSVSGSVSKACAPKSLALLEHSLHEEEVNPVRQTTATCVVTRERCARALRQVVRVVGGPGYNVGTIHVYTYTVQCTLISNKI